MKLLHFLKNYINSNNSLIYNEDFFENQKNDSENGAKTAVKSKGYAVSRRISAQEGKSNNKRGFLRVFKQSLNKEVQPVENTIKLIRNTFTQPAFRVRPFENKGVQPIETGRSMVEILGVMAVIGVLTVGGITGYRFAMEKYRANDIVNEVNLRNRDTWNMYQTKDLPDVIELEEWADVTQTGFPIRVYPRSHILFDIRVDEVPSRVCKNVLQMSLQGPKFIWTTTDEEGEMAHFYNGNNPEICDINNEGNVSMVFTTSLESFEGEKGLRPEDRTVCLTEEQCLTCETCFENEPFICQSKCDDSEPFCIRATDNPNNREGMCVECRTDADCEKDFVCAEHKCQPVTCKVGEFRSKAGVCIPCNTETNVRVSSEIDEKFQDGLSGVEMCQKCNNDKVPAELRYKRNLEVVSSADDEYFCSYACTIGVSVQSTSKITLQNPDGSEMLDEEGNPVKSVCRPCWDTRRVAIANETESKRQCEACGHEWYYANNDYWCVADRLNCPEGTVRLMYGNNYSCVPCDNKSFWFVNTNDASFDKRTFEDNSCRACTDFGIPREVHFSGGWPNCVKLCEQPDENSEESTSCLSEDPEEKKKCKRFFFDGLMDTCYPCDYTGSTNVIDTWSLKTLDFLTDLCEKCGRSINEKKYCAPTGDNACPLGKYLGVDGVCHDCSGKSFEIESEEKSGCQANCKVKSRDATTHLITAFYGPSDNADEAAAAETGRWIYRSDTNTYKCMKSCPEGYFQKWDGACYKCDTNSTGYDVLLGENQNTSDLSLKTICEQCPNRTASISTNTGSGVCALKDCSAALDTGTEKYKYVHTSCGECTRCDVDTFKLDEWWMKPDIFQQECEACGNRVYFSGTYYNGACILVKPGTYGICNNVELPSIDDDLRERAKDYLKPYTGLFRDNGYICRSCTDENAYTTTQAQCESCGNRRFQNGNCIYGLCTEGVTFANTSSTCIECGTTAPKTEIRSGTDFLCSSCSHKRVMKDADDKSYCVKDCEGDQWQDIGGTCRAYTYSPKNETNREIGTDDKSIELCRKAEHIAYSKTDDNGKIHWYCSQKPVADKFIDKDGQLIDCDTNDEPEIPDTNVSKNLCWGIGEISQTAGCDVNVREVTEKNGKFYCRKK